MECIMSKDTEKLKRTYNYLLTCFTPDVSTDQFESKLLAALDDGFDINFRPCSAQETLLQLAVSKNYADIAELLVYAGADPNISDEMERHILTLCFSKSFNYNIKFLEHLAKKTLNIDKKDIHGRTALGYICDSYLIFGGEYKFQEMAILYESGASLDNDKKWNTQSRFCKSNIQNERVKKIINAWKYVETLREIKKQTKKEISQHISGVFEYSL